MLPAVVVFGLGLTLVVGARDATVLAAVDARQPKLAAQRRDQRVSDQYDEHKRAEITASRLHASLTDLAGRPKALVITGEADVLRDEREAYGRKLREAGVDVTATGYTRASSTTS